MSAWDDRVNEKYINGYINKWQQDSELNYRQYWLDKNDSVLDNDPIADNPGYTNSRSGGGVDIYNLTRATATIQSEARTQTTRYKRARAMTPLTCFLSSATTL